MIQKEMGQYGESLVSDKLTDDGFAILERNFRKQSGEVDLIAQKNDLLVFVEVKLRQSTCIDLAELVPLSKQRKIIAAAKSFLLTYEQDVSYRFDVALVTKEDDTFQIHYIDNAFSADE